MGEGMSGSMSVQFVWKVVGMFGHQYVHLIIQMSIIMVIHPLVHLSVIYLVLLLAFIHVRSPGHSSDLVPLYRVCRFCYRLGISLGVFRHAK